MTQSNQTARSTSPSDGKAINRIRMRLEAGEAAVGAFLQLGSTEIVEIAGEVGYDFVVIDCEHGAFGLETAVQLIRTAEAAGTMPIVRVAGGTLKELGQFLDAGAMGLLVPQIASAEQARAVVSASKYRTEKFPAGTRGACPSVRSTRYGSPAWAEHATRSNRDCAVWLLVESAEGMDNLPQILDVPGIDGIQFGEFDLAVSMGCDGDRSHPAVLAKLEGAIELVRSRGIDVICFLDGWDRAAAAASRERLAAKGCRILLGAVDARIVFNVFRDRCDAARHGAHSLKGV